MISTFEIENYRSLKHLRLDDLNRVNLITGKNNCGKSSLLEAISIWATEGRLDGLRQILNNRKEIKNRDGSLGYNSIEDAIQDYQLLFHGRKINLRNPLFIKVASENEEIWIRFGKYNDKEIEENGERHMESGHETPDATEYNLGYRVSTKKNHKKGEDYYILSQEAILGKKIVDWHLSRNTKAIFVNASTTDSDFTREQLSKITLTPKEDILLRTLSIVESRIQRIGFSGDESDSRVLLRMKGNSSAIPMNSMGYGMNRTMSIVLGLVNAQDGFLLIDEFENGLHWTIQRQLWETIFEVSKKLNVQVFATTHSEDAIRAFAEAARSKGGGDAAFIRLNREGEEITATHYEPSELLFATENDIETRGL